MTSEQTGIAKAMGGKPLFANLDLNLSPGDKLGLLGANGSGKSTLLRALSGDVTPDAGTVTRAESLRVVVFEQGRASLDPTVNTNPGGGAMFIQWNCCNDVIPTFRCCR